MKPDSDTMSNKNKLDSLWSELTLIENLNDRRSVIYHDIQDEIFKYHTLAVEDPYKLFELMGGDTSDIEPKNWAFAYTYEDYMSENECDYDVTKANNWNLEEQSIKRAHDTGHWYVTGISILNGPGDVKLQFEFEFCEGYLDRIIGTPYNVKEQDKHGILFG